MSARASMNKPSRSPDAIFEQFGYDTTPNIRGNTGTLTKVLDLIQNRAVLSEFFAMTLFVWIGCGAAVSAQSLYAFNNESTLDNTFLLGVSIAFGFAISVLVYAIAPYSGGHINPAVTFAFWVIGEIDWIYAICYIVAQFLGAMLGAGLVWGSMNSTVLKQATAGDGGQAPPFLLGSNFVTAGEPLGSAFLLEFMGTFILVWTVCFTAVSKVSIAGNIAPIAIGWSVMLAHLVLIPFTGCGINPARTFGPHAVIMMAGVKVGVSGWWIYYTAPFVGGACAALVCKYIFGVTNLANPETQETVRAAYSQEGGLQEEEVPSVTRARATAEAKKSIIKEEEALGEDEGGA